MKNQKYEEHLKIGSIYVFSTDKKDIYKCGRTKNIQKRKSGLQTNCVEDLELLYEYKTSNDVLLESIIHDILKNYRSNSNREHFWCNLDYIKMLVGLPGDRIQVKEGLLYINDKPVTLERIEDHHAVDKDGHLLVIPQYIETLPNGVKHRILKSAPFGQGRLDNTEIFTVPEGHYFMMGDNRDNSSDSRVMSTVGYIPFENLIGRAEILFFSTESKWYEPWNWFFGLRYSRLLEVIN